MFESRIQLTNARWIGLGEYPYVIAEAGINHNGDIDIAKNLISEAMKSGADAIKFQKRTLDKMYTKEFLDKPYDKSYSFGKTYGEHKRYLEFSDEQYFELQEYAKSLSIEFIVSGFDFESFEFIDKKLNVVAHKIASPFITDFPLLKQVAQYGKPIFLSTGLHNMEEVKLAVEFIKQYNKKVVVLQATTLYPCPNKDVNLNVLSSFKKEFGTLVGYSSHDNGVILPAVSIGLGACVVEKHFTLDRTMVGPDHVASVEPRGLELICKYVKVAYEGLGTSKKIINSSEEEARIKYGVSIVSKSKIQTGELITAENITVKCPGGGISPVNYDKLIGKRVVKDIEADSIIYADSIENI